MTVPNPPNITPAPSPAPTRQDPANFRARADAYHSWLVPFINVELTPLTDWIKSAADQIFGWANSAQTSSTAATTSATTAQTAATAATTQAVAAAASATAAAASLDSFDDRYLGPKATNPTLDNDGNPLLTGALYFNTPSNEMRVWNGTSWAASYLPAAAYATYADLASTASGKGSELVAFKQAGTGAVTRTGQDKMRESVSRADYDSDANFNAAKSGKVSVDSANRLRSTSFIAGTEELSGAAARDSFVAARNVTGLTDCHAFADRTIIDSVTDAGTYGTFDATTELRGSHVQNHVYGFQDRNKYAGSGTLQDITGFLSVPTFSGTGTINSRQGIDIRNVNTTGDGTLLANIGVLIRNQTAGASNVGLNIQQIGGYAIFANGGAKSRHAGQFGIGTEPATGAKLHVDGGTGVNDVSILVTKTDGYSILSNNNSKLYHYGNAGFGLRQNTDGVSLTVSGSLTGPKAYIHTSATVAFFGQIGGDFAIQWVSNGAARLELAPSAASYAFRPGADNTQPLGDTSKRWSVVYAGTGTISTSDARTKQDDRPLSEKERAVALKAKTLLKAFRFKDSVAEKGDKARIHFGVYAQELMAAFESEGLKASNYAMFCHDTWKAEPEQRDEDGKVISPAREAGDRYGIRYDQLLAFVIAAL